MSVFDVVRTALAIRQFQDRPIPAEIVEQIIESARLTGSSRNLQPWHFVVVQSGATLREMGALATSGPYIAQAPLAVVVLIEESSFAVSDASRAIQSMVLTAWEAGIGSNWVGFLDFGGLEDVKPLLGIPDRLKVLAIVPFGYPVAAIGQGKKKRKPSPQVISSERFGQPLGPVE